MAPSMFSYHHKLETKLQENGSDDKKKTKENGSGDKKKIKENESNVNKEKD